MCCTAIDAKHWYLSVSLCSACEWHLLCLHKLSLSVLWSLTLFRRYVIPYYLHKKCWSCLWPWLVVQIVSHHVNLHPTFHWSYTLSMYVNSTDKCKDVGDLLSSPSFRRYVRHVYLWSLTDHDVTFYCIREYVIISGNWKIIYWLSFLITRK